MVQLGPTRQIHVTISGASSVDGKIAITRRRRSRGSGSENGPLRLSSDADVARVHRLRNRSDSILVGINTVLSDDPMLNVRHARRGAKSATMPVRVVLDSAARTPIRSKIIKTCHDIRTIIAVSRRAPKSRIKILEAAGADVVVLGKDVVNIRLLLAYLWKTGIRSVLVEGGGAVNWEFIRKRLADRIIIAVSPFVLGGGKKESVSLVGGAGFSRLSCSPEMRLESVRRLGNHVILSYAIHYK